MKIQVEKLSEMSLVKPSTPTPDHLRHCQLSSLDQIMVRVFSPWVLVYPRNPNITNKERCERLKKSLSETLTLFYPFAGRVMGNSHIDCNDEGVPFVEAKARGTILDILRNPYCNHFNDLIPFDVTDPIDLVAYVQVTHFDCGGMVVGAGISHKIADAMSGAVFLGSWAAVARGDHNTKVPRFDAAKYFSPVNASNFDTCFEMLKGEHGIVSRRFLFSASSIAAIRERYNSTGHQKPTRIESLTSFISNRLVKSTGLIADSNTCCIIKHALNLRSRMKPPLSDNHMGNFIYEPVVAVVDKNSDDGLRCVINQMRETIRKVETEHELEKLQDGEGHLQMMMERAEAQGSGQVVPISFSSCCRLSIYECDFGWGKPFWVGLGLWPQKNLIMIFDAKEKDGLEIYVMLEKELMEKFEIDDDLASFASPAMGLQVSNL